MASFASATAFPTWAERKRPDVKRTYQGKLKTSSSAGLGQSLLKRAIWAYDALFTPQAFDAPSTSPEVDRKSRVSLQSRFSECDSSASVSDDSEIAASFSRLSIAKVRQTVFGMFPWEIDVIHVHHLCKQTTIASPVAAVSPQTVCEELTVEVELVASPVPDSTVAPTAPTLSSHALSTIASYLPTCDVMEGVWAVDRRWHGVAVNALAARCCPGVRDSVRHWIASCHM